MSQVVINSTSTIIGSPIVFFISSPIITPYMYINWYLNDILVGNDDTYILESPIEGDQITADISECTWITKISKPEIIKTDSVFIGDIVPVDMSKTITFSTVNTSNYVIIGSLRSISSDWNTDNDVFWMVRAKTETSFTLLFRDILTGVIQSLYFDYALIKY